MLATCGDCLAILFDERLVFLHGGALARNGRAGGSFGVPRRHYILLGLCLQLQAPGLLVQLLLAEGQLKLPQLKLLLVEGRFLLRQLFLGELPLSLTFFLLELAFRPRDFLFQSLLFSDLGFCLQALLFLLKPFLDEAVLAEQAKIAEDAGAVAVMALERVPADIRAEGGVSRMSDPDMIDGIIAAVSIPVMAKARIGHFAEAQILQSLGDLLRNFRIRVLLDQGLLADFGGLFTLLQFGQHLLLLFGFYLFAKQIGRASCRERV